MSSIVRRKSDLIYLSILAGITIIGSSYYHFFHLLCDFLTIIIMALVYVLATKCYRYTKNDYSLFMGYSLLVIGIVFLIRILLNYRNHGFPLSTMAMAHSGAFLFEAVIFLCAPFFIRRKFSGIFFAISVVLILFLDITLVRYFGDTLIHGNILWLSCGIILLLALSNLSFHRRQLNDSIFLREMAAMILLAGASFLRIGTFVNTLKLIPDLLRFGAYILVYQGTISLPFESIFHEFKKRAIIDELTGLYNRQGLREFAKKVMARADREGLFIGVLLMDLDRFKLINDRHGHLAGDRIIQQFANILKDSIRETDIICRLGGDEFVVVLSAKELNPNVIRDRIIAEVERWQSTNELAAKIGVSIGIGIREPGSSKGLEEILKEADHHMYRDKNKKKPVKKREEANQYKMFG